MPRLSKIGAAALAAFGWTSGVSAVSASYLVVAGGGGGYIGGGGAGGLLTGTATLNPTLSYTVTVGAGGASNVNGGNSVFNAVTATGGGGGAAGGAANSGGSGGGGSYSSGAGAAGTSGQGNAGGSGSASAGGGGGGASAVGGNGSGSNGGNGGAGTASSISGSSVTYAGGGGGSCASGGSSTGGSGGGGNGSYDGSTTTGGTANTGGGGGGAQTVTSPNGGSGVVIISYVGAQQFGGGNVTSSGGNTIHTFNTSGTLSPLSSLTATYLIVAGGGAGGNSGGISGLSGGGGAGGLLTGTGITIDTNSNYVVTVGAGGTATANSNGGNGGNSSWSMVSTTAVGGGGGGGAGNNGGGQNGGSGGGATATSGSGTFAGGTGTSGQGNNGGSSLAVSGVGNWPGGGGGSGAAGTNAIATVSGAGGVGTASSISGTSTYYAGGGGGASQYPIGSPSLAAGGAGGGGAGSNTGVAGTAGTGGGGGGGTTSTSPTGNGGSGVVIISYPGSTQQMAGGTVTISGGNVIHTFTTSGYLTPIKYVSRSLRFRSSASAWLNRTIITVGNRQKWTISMWVKRGALTPNNTLVGAGNSATGGGTGWAARFQSGGALQISAGGGVTMNLVSTAVYRDPSAWYHIVFAMDTTQATAANRFRVYINNAEITSWATNTQIAQNTSLNWNYQNPYIATENDAGTLPATPFDGYMAEVINVDGQQLTPSSFGTFNSYGVWQPITYGGSYGTNGFYLTFGNNTSTTTLGYDTSPMGNNWTTNNISLTSGATYDSMLDVPTLTSATAANYATWNAVNNGTTNSYTFSNGNLSATVTTTSGGRGITSTSGMTSTSGFKYYAELTVSAWGSSSNADVGILNTTTTVMTTGSFALSGCIGSYLSNGYSISKGGNVYNNGTSLASSLTTFADGDIVQIAYDGTYIYFGKNGTWLNSAVPASGTGGYSVAAGTYAFAFGVTSNTSQTGTVIGNFGQRPFTYTAPTGFVALNTYNLSTPTIPNGATQTAATLYTGTNATLAIANTVNGTNFQPDFVWIKSRSNSTNHALFDSVRGVRAVLSSNATAAEVLDTAGTSLTSFDSTGFSLGTTSATAGTNVSGQTYVAWQWKANGTGVTNTSGSITSTVSANTTAGFSIVTYTGTGANATVGHGLGVAPSMVIAKNRTTADDWMVWHSAFPGTDYILLNSTGAKSTLATVWNSTVPSSTVFSLGTNLTINRSGNANVAYVFAAIAGYSAFGSYAGNSSTDGPFIYTGFRPRWILIRSTTGARDWLLYDTSRLYYNDGPEGPLQPNTSGTAYSGGYLGLDILANGFKLRESTINLNASGETMIYACFAENPFKYSNAR